MYMTLWVHRHEYFTNWGDIGQLRPRIEGVHRRNGSVSALRSRLWKHSQLWVKALSERRPGNSSKMIWSKYCESGSVSGEMIKVFHVFYFVCAIFDLIFFSVLFLFCLCFQKDSFDESLSVIFLIVPFRILFLNHTLGPLTGAHMETALNTMRGTWQTPTLSVHGSLIVCYAFQPVVLLLDLQLTAWQTSQCESQIRLKKHLLLVITQPPLPLWSEYVSLLVNRTVNGRKERHLKHVKCSVSFGCAYLKPQTHSQDKKALTCSELDC